MNKRGVKEAEQVSIFPATAEYTQYEEMRKKAIKSVRVRFKNPTYRKYYKEDVHTDGTKTYTMEKYAEMNRLYIELANRFPFPLRYGKDRNADVQQLDENTFYIDTGPIRTYKLVYKREKYTHKGDDGVFKEYTGEAFETTYAEIKGTEDFGINERLFIHSELLNYIEAGYQLKDLNMWLGELINMFESGWTAEAVIVLLLNLRAESGILL